MESLATVFGKRLKLLRKARGLTQEQLGEKAGIDYKHIGAIERGVKTPSFDAIERLAKALKVNYYEMFLSDQRPQKEDADFEVLIKDIEKHGAPALKRFLLQVLSGFMPPSTKVKANADRLAAILGDLIPKGKLSCYESVGEIMKPKLFVRQVAKACSDLGKRFFPEDVPYHRIIHKDGRLPKEFTGGGCAEHRRLLHGEGHEFIKSEKGYEVENFKDCLARGDVDFTY